MKILILVLYLVVSILAMSENEPTGTNCDDHNNTSYQIQGIVPRGYVAINGTNYYISPTNVNARQATQFCNDLGMKLVSFQTAEKYLTIKDYLKDNGLGDKFYYTSGRLLIDMLHWTGTGQMFTYTSWGTGMPNSRASMEECVAVKASFGWDDRNCVEAWHFICE